MPLMIPIEYANGDESALGEVSDGYHSFASLYLHRHALFICLLHLHPTHAWKSLKHHDGSTFPGWFIAGLHLPTGPITYHLPQALWLVAHVRQCEQAPPWDGHTPEDVLGRLLAWAKML